MTGIIDQRLQGTVGVGLVVLMALGLSIQRSEVGSVMEPSAFSLPPKPQFLPPRKRALIEYCIADRKALRWQRIQSDISR